jgi:DNA-binding beta-propeller fold protein YncE
MKRRTFNQTLLSVGMLSPLRHVNAYPRAVIGHGNFRYRVDTDWCRAVATNHPVQDCHEMAFSSKGLLYLSTNDTHNNVLVMNKDGEVVNAWGKEYPGAHGLTLHDENGSEFLYITDYERHAVFKTTLEGRVIQTFRYPAEAGLYDLESSFRPTESVVAPDGTVFIADGYGQDYILAYGPDGRFLYHFGGKGGNPESLNNAHGVALDYRERNNPVVVVTSRVENCFKRYTAEGRFLGKISLPGAYVCRPVIHGAHLFCAVLISKMPWDSQSGFVMVLDRDNRVVSVPGGSDPQGDLPFHQTIRVFRHPHDVAVDTDGNLYVSQWNAGKVYPYRLTRVL